MKNNKVLKMFLEQNIKNNIKNNIPFNKIYPKLLKDKDSICRLWNDTKPLFKEIEDKLQQFYFKESDFVHKQEIYSKVRFESPGDTVPIEIVSDLLKIFNIKEKPIRAIVTIGGSYMLPRILVTLEENKQVFLNYFDTVYIINKINNMFHEIRTLIFCILNRIDNFGIQAPLIAHISLPVR